MLVFRSRTANVMAVAASRDVQKQLSNIVECSVCYEIYNDPRQLPCIHSYCLKCITEFCGDKLPGSSVACPLCRTEFNIPQTGTAGLPKNFFLQQLKELASPSNAHCDVCSTRETEAAVRKVATKFCVDCSERLCETCADIHGRMRVTKGHHLVKQDGDDESSESRVRLTRIYCDKHQDKVLELYCFDCMTGICMMCFVKSHKSHECSDINEVADEFRRQMTGDITNMHNTVTRCCGIIKGEQRNKKKFNKMVEDVERNIYDRVDKLKQLIDKEKSSLLNELKSFRAERNKQIDNVIEEIKQHVSFVESLMTYTEQLREKGRSGDVTQQRSSLKSRADELLKQDVIHGAVSELGSVDVTFAAATWSTSNGDIVGKISKKRIDGESVMQL